MAKEESSEITLRITLDENRIPEKLNWSAEDGGIVDEEAKAMLLSVWDSKNKES
ncbi:MAG: gliding motility protein GldC, partial [Eudoraea sp.]|nr:gliding motility protein GldC [Eudoraea sp.]